MVFGEYPLYQLSDVTLNPAASRPRVPAHRAPAPDASVVKPVISLRRGLVHRQHPCVSIPPPRRRRSESTPLCGPKRGPQFHRSPVTAAGTALPDSLAVAQGADCGPAPVWCPTCRLLRLRSPEPEPGSQLLGHHHDQVRAAVLRAALGRVVVGDRAIFAVADRAQPRRRDAAAHEVVARRVGAALAERQVVLLRCRCCRSGPRWSPGCPGWPAAWSPRRRGSSARPAAG